VLGILVSNPHPAYQKDQEPQLLRNDASPRNDYLIDELSLPI